MYMRLLYYNNVDEKYLGLKKPLSLACDNLGIVFEKWSDNKASDWMCNYDIGVFHGEPYNKEDRYTISEIMDPKLLSSDGLVVLYVSRSELPVKKEMIEFSDVKTGLVGRRYVLNILDTIGCGLTTEDGNATKLWESLLKLLKDHSAVQALVDNDLSQSNVLEMRRYFCKRRLVFLNCLCVMCQKYLILHFPNPLDARGIIREALDTMGWTNSIAGQADSALMQNFHENKLGTEKPSWWQSILCMPQIKNIDTQKNLLTQHILEEWDDTELPNEVSRLVDAIFSQEQMETTELIAQAFIVIAKRLEPNTI